jgi:hypothetical protein
LGTWSKNYWADCEKVYIKVIKKMFHKGSVIYGWEWGLSEMAYFMFGYSSSSSIYDALTIFGFCRLSVTKFVRAKLGTSVDGHEKIIT